MGEGAGQLPVALNVRLAAHPGVFHEKSAPYWLGSTSKDLRDVEPKNCSTPKV